MRRHAITALLSAFVLLSLTACGDDGSKDTPPKTETTAPMTPATTEEAKTAELPNLVGKGLQSAQDAAQAAGFYVLASHDSLGRGRNQQDPQAGTELTGQPVSLTAVKFEESCP